MERCTSVLGANLGAATAKIVTPAFKAADVEIRAEQQQVMAKIEAQVGILRGVVEVRQ